MPDRNVRRTPISLRLSLTTLIVLVIGMGVAAVMAWLAVERLFLDTQRENLLAQAALTASTLEGMPLELVGDEPYSQTSNVLPGIHTRLLGEQGAVLLSLPIAADQIEMQVPLAENAGFVPSNELLERPEIQSALAGASGTMVRRVASAGNRRVLYAAAPVVAGDGGVSGIIYLAMPLPPARLPTSILLQLAGAFMAAILLAWAAGRLLSRRITRPLEDLVHAAGAVAEGQLDQRVPAESKIRELHTLGEAFNDMTARLRQSDQAKSAFIADITHELRTPLTVINGTIETLEDGALDDTEGRGPLLASMGRETTRLIRLVNDLLVLTRADVGALNLQVRSFDLGELARMRCENMARVAASRQVTLHVDAPEEAIVRGDPDRLSQVLDNLLDNAIRHAPEGSGVDVRIQQEGNEIRCTVHDRGPGIPAEHLPMIFERFYRIDSSRNRHSGGSGLGLAIVRSLVAAQGGRLRAESVEGQGAVFIFWLPACTNDLNKNWVGISD